MTEPQNVSGLMDQIHDLKRQLADAETRGAVKALRDIGGTLLALGYADAETHVIRYADRIESGEVTP